MKRRITKYDNKNLKSNLIRITLIVFVVIFIVSLYFANKVKVEISVENSSLNEMMAVNIYTKKGGRYIDADEVQVDLRHTYKKDESLSVKLKDYEPGKYILYYYPQLQGKYLLDVNAKIDGVDIYKNYTIEVK